MSETISLDALPWYWKQRDESIPRVLDEISEWSSWRKAQSFPSEVHVELLKANLIPDPYLGFNEHKVQWIADVEWLYSTKLPTPSLQAHTELVFHGLDAVVDVYLNEELILSSNNQFQIHTVPISLKLEGNNVLFFHFKSAKLLAKELEKKFGRVRGGSTNLGDPSRVYVRKAQYDWRWDWGPELHTAGPYRNIELKTYEVQLYDLYARTTVDHASSQRTLNLDLTIQGAHSLAKKAKVILSKWGSNSSAIREEVIPLSVTTKEVKDVVKWDLKPEEVSLWWPSGYGDQVLYELEVDILDDNDNVLSTLTKRIGFRTVELVQTSLSEPDQYGRGSSFFFRVNNTPIFAVGSNWIPADNFLTTISKDRYRDWMKLARDGGQNMIRVWGGGVYEDEALVDACDEFGLLLWHDFQFACGVYPGAQFPEFVESVKKEAEDNVKRFRNHPCMALWCGNNEDYQMVLQWGDVPSLPATLFYEDILPSIVKSLTNPPTPYWPGSPYGGEGWDTADPTVGDIHQWNIWGGKEFPWHNYNILGGRFVSEFGIPSLPSMKTIEYYFKDETEDSRKRNWHPQSKVVAQHTKAGVFERRFAIVMNDNFRVTEDLETYSYRTELMQSCAIGYAYSIWRREWRGQGKEYCGGVLVWQLNDCWPGTSWALVDYFLRPKPVYYAIKRAGAPVALGIYRTVQKNRNNDRPKQFYEYGAYQTVSATIDVWIASSLVSPLKGEVEVELTFFDLEDSSWGHQERKTIEEVKANQTTEVLKGFSVPGSHSGGNVVVLTRLMAENKEIVRETDWPQPYRYLELPQDPGLTVTFSTDGHLEVEVKRPVKGVFFEAESDIREGETYSKVRWSDNGVDLVPGERRVFDVRGLPDRVEIRARWLGNEKGVIVAALGET